MNIVRIPRLLKQTTLLLTVLGSSFLLSACGGDDDKGTSTASSSSSSVSSHTFSSTPVTPPFDGTWPKVKVSANHTKTLKFEWTAAPNATYYKLWKKADKDSAYAQVGPDFTATTISDPVSVHLTDWVNSRYKVQACDASAVCSDSTEIIIDSAMLSSITYVKAHNADAGDWFGWSIAISGDGKTLAVGAPAESSSDKGVTVGDKGGASNDSPTSGAVYVFAKIDGNWVQEAYLKASNTEQPNENRYLTLPNDRFGYQISLSDDGNTLAVSAIGEDSPSYGIDCREENEIVSQTVYNSSSSSSIVSAAVPYNLGAIYIFNRSNASWTQSAYIKANQELQYSNFGTYFVLSGDGKTLAVGNPDDSSYILSSSSTSSSNSSFECLKYNLSSSSSSSSSSSLSSSSNPSSSSDSSSSSSVIIYGGSGSGAIYIFKLVGSTWQQAKRVKAPDAYPGDRLGISIALSFNGDILAAGAVGAEEMVLNSSSSSVKATLKLTVSNTEFTDARDSGAVYLFKYTNDAWEKTDKVIPAPQNQGWKQFFGAAIALSQDAKTLAIGSPGDWSKGKGVNSDASDYTYEADLAYNSSGYYYYIVPKYDLTREKSSYTSGAVYVYTRPDDASNWTQQSYLKASNPQTGYQFGSSLSLSGNGDVLAVGSYLESSLSKGVTGIAGEQLDTSSPSSGAAYIFKRKESVWTYQNYVKAPNSNANDRFARALSLDFTGDILAIGAHRESSKTIGINPTNTTDTATAAPASGAAYIY